LGRLRHRDLHSDDPAADSKKNRDGKGTKVKLGALKVPIRIQLCRGGSKRGGIKAQQDQKKENVTSAQDFDPLVAETTHVRRRGERGEIPDMKMQS